ncbi:hypothetical protein XENOCAPTIV_026289 [Xenoophorus captivus]|uniref:Uncharacterized protein n=1 Tax=Xenoophorus captivus TaxID=1517983 RepID=A0ABV0QUB4_9TELE
MFFTLTDIKIMSVFVCFHFDFGAIDNTTDKMKFLPSQFKKLTGPMVPNDAKHSIECLFLLFYSQKKVSKITNLDLKSDICWGDITVQKLQICVFYRLLKMELI